MNKSTILSIMLGLVIGLVIILIIAFSIDKETDEVIYKDNKIVSGYIIREDNYKVRGKDLTVSIKETYENGKIIDKKNITDLSYEHNELMYRFGRGIVLEMKYPTQKIIKESLLAMPQLLTQIENPPFETVLKLIEAYKGNVRLYDIKFSKLNDKQLIELYKIGIKYKREKQFFKYIKSINPNIVIEQN